MNKRTLVTRKNAPYFFITPVCVVFTVFMVYPILRSLYLSFFELVSGSYEFVGFPTIPSCLAMKSFIRAFSIR